ncbi:uncharacterized protein LOC109811976 [Cajanus cajan]|nr:uncharacterized protein LOC109811976 [Cajanus cajan]
MQGIIRTRGTASSEPLLNDPEIERTARRNNSNRRIRRTRANPVNQPTNQIPEVLVSDIPEFNMEGEGDNHNRRRTIGDAFTYTSPREFSSIVRPTRNDRLAEMKPALLQLISSHQFSGLDHEDPHTHLYTFYELCGSVGVSGADEEALFMRLFPFSLNGKAKAWLHSQPNQSLATWRDVETKFLARFFPPSKNTEARTAIATFAQGADEPLCEAWERYKSLLRRCPNHGFEVEHQVQTFCNGLQPQTKMILDASFGGSVMFRTAEEAITIIESMASTDFRSQHGRSSSHKRGVLELSTQDAVLAQNKILSQQIEALNQQMAKLPQQFQAMHANNPPMQQVLACDFCGGDHLNGFCAGSSNSQGEEVNYMGNQGRQNFSQHPYPQNSNQGWRNNYGGNKPDMNASSSSRPPHQHQHPPLYERTTKLEDTLQQFMQLSMSNQKNTDASIKNLEIQVGQIAKQLAEQQKGSFSANTEQNPKGHLNVVSTRSGREFVVKENEKKKESEEVNDMSVEDDASVDEEIILEGPGALRRSGGSELINIPFSEALEQMPTYAKFMKDLLTKKRKYFEEETITLEAGCSAIIQKMLPTKSKDPGSFTLPVTIGSLAIGKALLDLGASINLMPLSMLQRIGDLEVKPTRMTLQLADRSVKYPHGIVEDVLVKVDRFLFPADFVVMDIEEDIDSVVFSCMQGTIRTRGTASSEPLLNDPEIERTARRNNSNRRIRRTRANPVNQPTNQIPEVKNSNFRK